MKIAMISFTAQGAALNERLGLLLRERGEDCESFVLPRFAPGSALTVWRGSLPEWTREQFAEREALIYIGACGIAVRSIAPLVRDKYEDAAVLCVDESGRFVIPLLSGHVGGANELAERVATLLSAQAVITTATDVNGCFAVDVFARKNELILTDRVRAREISAAVLEGETVQLSVAEELPALLWGEELPEREEEKRAWLFQRLNWGVGETGLPAALTLQEGSSGLTIQLAPSMPDAEEGDGLLKKSGTLTLIPRCLVLGIGCRKGVAPERIEALVRATLAKLGWDMRAVREVATIDRKKEEPGLLAFCEKLRVPLISFSAEELNAATGEFTASPYVKQVTGTDNVCERAASRCGRLLSRKKAEEGVTVAVALRW